MVKLLTQWIYDLYILKFTNDILMMVYHVVRNMESVWFIYIQVEQNAQYCLEHLW